MISLVSQDLKTTMALFVYLSINIMEMASKACFMIGHYSIQSHRARTITIHICPALQNKEDNA